ncbi:MAG: MBOAT family O-acyltransferase [Lachnospiraceae bacterium]|nr:MBOAT family protein [Lachnospiraceae bacterium]MDO4207300.1 MBOAT family O-acyltransferase [Lachnospiraceae bacterium]
MVFSGNIFLFVFLPVTLLFYFNPFTKKCRDGGRTFKNIVLLVASLVFYGWGEPRFVFIMMISIVLNYLIGLGLGKYEQKAVRHWLLAALLLLNLGLLFVFKYLGFVSGIFGGTIRIALPLGISFYTFQILSYGLDVYFNKDKVQKNILLLGVYISMFPQLVAGPIVRYADVSEELLNRKETSADITYGVRRFVYGLGKKVLLANFLAIIADYAFLSPGTNSVATSWLGTICYTLQIYFDFSGYSDMAIGLGRIFGFHFPENFDYPYVSLSFTEYWRRWHMTLGSWMKDYLFYPLQKSDGMIRLGGWARKTLGKKKGKYVPVVLSLLVLWLAMGFWHGANWNFVIWGLLFFVLMSFESLTGIGKKALKSAAAKGFQAKKIVYHIYVIFFLLIAYVLFRAESLPLAFRYIGNMFGGTTNTFVDGDFWKYLKSIRFLLPAAILLCTPFARWISGKIRKPLVRDIGRGVVVLAIFVLSVLSIVTELYNPFIYFNF